MAYLIKDLGYWAGRWFNLFVMETEAHDDVEAWYAPSECHEDVSRSYDEMRQDLVYEMERAGISYSRYRKELKARCSIGAIYRLGGLGFLD